MRNDPVQHTNEPLATFLVPVWEIERREFTESPPSDGRASAIWERVPLGSEGVVAHSLRITAEAPSTITRADGLRMQLAGPDRGSHWRVHAFDSSWGNEFLPVEKGTTRHNSMVEVRSGRSSHGANPCVIFERENDGAAVIVAPAWSGNWYVRTHEGGLVVAGMSPWLFSRTLAPGASMQAPAVLVSSAPSMAEASVRLQRAVRDHWLARSAFADSIPTEWNHWWPYEDADVDADVVAHNAAAAAGLGLEIATLDAGWFGDSARDSDWQEQRGDWHRVNTARFPGGLEALGDRIQAAGVAPGIWMEAEALSPGAEARRRHPEMVALAVDGRRRDPSYLAMELCPSPTEPTFLGYVCLGSPAGRQFVLSSLNTAVEAIGARWLKLDFNLEPDAGCTRVDHGHGAGDGLLAHYEGLYEVLDQFREQHPEVLVEACSSGGLRVDLGLARHIHAFFLSDPDYTEHHLQVAFGASTFLPPLALLHFSQSQWRGGHPEQQVDWGALATADFDSMLRAAMIHRIGISMKLDELRPELRERLRVHIRIFKEVVRPILPTAVLEPLTPLPVRGGLGERCPAAQLTSREAIVAFAWRLSGGVSRERIRIRGIEGAGECVVTDLATGRTWHSDSEVLAAEGLRLSGGDASSWMFHIAFARRER